jgi:polar amino acid transport system substrate-binding protein
MTIGGKGMRAREWIVFAVLWAGALWLLLACHDPAPVSQPERRGAALEHAPASAPQPLAIAVEDDAAPWSQLDGTGYANDLVRAAFAAVGIDVRFTVVPYARCKQMAIDGEVAACFAMSRGPELAGSVVFPEQPLFVCRSELVLRDGDSRTLTGLDGLPAGSVVGVVLGYEYPEALYALERAGTITLERSRSEDLNLRKLAAGRIGAAVVNANDVKPLSYMLAKAGVAGRVRPGFVLGELSSYVGFSRSHPRGLEARLRYDEGLRQIVQRGEKSRIDAHWISRSAAETAHLTKQRAGPEANLPAAP